MLNRILDIAILPFRIVRLVIIAAFELACALLFPYLLWLSASWVFGPESMIYPSSTAYTIVMILAVITGLVGLLDWLDHYFV
jgi:hypothetical protein